MKVQRVLSLSNSPVLRVAGVNGVSVIAYVTGVVGAA
jgi:hypothetical protein